MATICSTDDRLLVCASSKVFSAQMEPHGLVVENSFDVKDASDSLPYPRKDAENGNDSRKKGDNTDVQDDSHVVVGDRAGHVCRYTIGPSSTSGYVDMNGEESPYEGKPLTSSISMVLDVALSRNGKFLFIADRDEKVRVSRYPKAYVIQSFCLGHSAYVSSLAVCGDRLFSSGGDGIIFEWDPENGTPIAQSDKLGDEPIRRIALLDKDKADRIVAIVGGSILLLDEALKPVKTIKTSEFLMDMIPFAGRVIAASSNGLIEFNLSDGTSHSVEVPDELAQALSLSKDPISNYFKNVTHQNIEEYYKRKAEKIETTRENQIRKRKAKQLRQKMEKVKKVAGDAEVAIRVPVAVLSLCFNPLQLVYVRNGLDLSVMVSFVVVRVTYDAALVPLLEQLENLDLPYSICSGPHNLKVPPEQSADNLLGSLDFTAPVPHATGTAEVLVSGEEIDVLSLLNDSSEQKAIDGSEQKTSDEMKPSQECLFEKVGTSKESDVSLQNPPQPPEIWRRATTLQFPIPGHHVIGNIKRYRRQKCKTSLVNAWVLYCKNIQKISFLQFKEEEESKKTVQDVIKG
ncbi:unnamed protein product [Nippostrongylus brasiliensis]|uniref:WD_REPEATS_REGION domain-containing protein n=1 Tax=Nippostrongylus brasiliensis TaxID=27835 RepID=A0A158R3E3_NIPBR|nr:unnamed protein product [Nippostrongylus brasiliensis]